MSSTSAPTRRSFPARSAAIAAVPEVATLAGVPSPKLWGLVVDEQ